MESAAGVNPAADPKPQLRGCAPERPRVLAALVFVWPGSV